MKEYDRDKLFPIKQVTYYNEYTKFIGKTVKLTEVETFIRGCISYIYSVKKFTWKYFVTRQDKHGNKIVVETRQISKDPPFHNSDDFNIFAIPTKEGILLYLGFHNLMEWQKEWTELY